MGPAEQYDRFIGRYLPTLAAGLADYADIRPGTRVVDIGCGPGGLTTELASRVGARNVAGIDPAPQFAAACRERNPGVDIREGVAEDLPWPTNCFDAALSSLVIGFMTDPDAGITEMVRVVRPGGTVTACVWDMTAGGMTMLGQFWDAVRTVKPDAGGEQAMPGATEGDIAERFIRSGLIDVTAGALYARASYVDFQDFWEPFTYGVGPSGHYLNSLSVDEQARVREACRSSLPKGSFTLKARAWCARGTVNG